ncbi:helix-turn-helix transcriptional regulator [Aquella oligotrophica]|uniref:HTH luxR-type domain-containing protein n=1 Tax=Aquella oligotrophica TaxID=2067065 RepID=A0A2I7N937_9NEIS|nr:helix-turn-helix transcriptional regulator [Aquella oligotrophica]AUR52959.1 hypothetical protein CUN60_11850 [Aquella oligotrophica]
MNQKQQNLSDEAFFEYYCSSADIVYNNGEQEAIFIKDKNYAFRYISPGYISDFDPESSVLTETQEKLQTEEERTQARIILQQDELIRKNLETHKFIYVDSYKHIILIHKSPIINPSTNNFVGILGSAQSFMLPNVLDIIYKINGVNFGLINKEQSKPLKYELTPRQHMILFFYLNKYSYSEVSIIMSTLGYKISAGRVNNHLENLKYIFAVKTKEQLIEKAISLKYHLFIPRQLLKVGSYELNDVLLISK